MTKPLYEFKVGDQVWKLGKPGVYGTIISISNDYFEGIVRVSWLRNNQLITKVHFNTDDLRPRILRKTYQPYRVGVMKHTEEG